MDKLSSTEFRKTFAGLSKPTEVTVNGHTIGTWRPLDLTGQEREEYAGELRPFNARESAGFNSRPFTPSPKKGK